jgi:hypothetical protein
MSLYNESKSYFTPCQEAFVYIPLYPAEINHPTDHSKPPNYCLEKRIQCWIP